MCAISWCVENRSSMVTSVHCLILNGDPMTYYNGFETAPRPFAAVARRFRIECAVDGILSESARHRRGLSIFDAVHQ